MSRIADRLQSLRRTSSPMGFGMAGSSAGVRRMLILAGVRKIPVRKTLSAILGSADSVVVIGDGEGGKLRIRQVVGLAGDVPVGARLWKGAPLTEVLSDSGCDFIICDAAGPAGALALEGVGCFVEVAAGVESNRLRAIGDLGVEAVVLSTESLDMRALAIAIECRRVRTASGRPVVLRLDESISSDEVTVLWRAGVGALFIDASDGMELLTSARAAVDGASYEARQSLRDTSASIGVHVASSNGSGVEEEEEEDGDEEDGGDEEEE
ncbi:MAG: hypothetical protein IMY84_05740 [Chloroflexi bacterium]|nr:hypothetical protein [Chloroflexota bacterium]